MSETWFKTKKICAHPVQKEVNDGTGVRVITAKCNKPMKREGRTRKIVIPGGNGATYETIEHGLFCDAGHRAGRM